MRVLFWNCHGLKKLQTIPELGDLVRAQDPTSVSLTETWLDEARLGVLCDTLKLKNFSGFRELQVGVAKLSFGSKILIFGLRTHLHNTLMQSLILARTTCGVLQYIEVT